MDGWFWESDNERLLACPLMEGMLKAVWGSQGGRHGAHSRLRAGQKFWRSVRELCFVIYIFFFIIIIIDDIFIINFIFYIYKYPVAIMLALFIILIYWELCGFVYTWWYWQRLWDAVLYTLHFSFDYFDLK